jgi:PEP-CTERM motif
VWLDLEEQYEMAKTRKSVLRRALLSLGLVSVGAQASELFLSTKTQFDIADLAAGTSSYQATFTQSADGQYIAQAAPASNKLNVVAADDVFIKNLYEPAGAVAASSSGSSWWNPTGGAGSTSSDASACNMVASWANFSDGAGCNAKQWSTIASLEQMKDLSVVAVMPIGGSSESVYIGDVTGNPEPGTWAMMLGGVAMLGYFKRRKSVSRQ